MSTKKEVRTIPSEHVKALSEGNTSFKIRYLTALGFSQGDVARYLDIRPQHVNNVLKTPVKNPKHVVPSSVKPLTK